MAMSETQWTRDRLAAADAGDELLRVGCATCGVELEDHQETDKPNADDCGVWKEPEPDYPDPD